MKDKEVLQKAIEIAKNNGYELPSVFGVGEPYDSDRFKVWKLFFSHDFAKAFWGEEPFDGFKNYFDNGYRFTFKPLYEMCENPEEAKKTDAEWKAHLQQMVLFDNPIDYLRKFVPNTEHDPDERGKCSDPFTCCDKCKEEYKEWKKQQRPIDDCDCEEFIVCDSCRNN
jgi:hypothetical protein